MSKRRNHSVGSKLYVGMTDDEVKKLLTETCTKCKHLVDDHFRDLGKKSKYVCRYCECKIS